MFVVIFLSICDRGRARGALAALDHRGVVLRFPPAGPFPHGGLHVATFAPHRVLKAIA